MPLIAPSARVLLPSAPNVGSTITGSAASDSSSAAHFLPGTVSVVTTCTSMPDSRAGEIRPVFVS